MRSGLTIIARVLLFAFLPLLYGCQEEEEKELFSVVFMTDIHLQPERNAVEGFTMAIEAANDLEPDFIITGGDLVMDDMAEHVQFITGGAVSGSSWWGPYLIFEEGFVHLTFTDDDFDWRYADYGWDALK